jgi:hypothetical protein
MSILFELHITRTTLMDHGEFNKFLNKHIREQRFFRNTKKGKF